MGEAFPPISTPGTTAEAGPDWPTPHRGKNPPSSVLNPTVSPASPLPLPSASDEAEEKHGVGNFGGDPGPPASVSPSLLPAVLP